LEIRSKTRIFMEKGLPLKAGFPLFASFPTNFLTSLVTLKAHCSLSKWASSFLKRPLPIKTFKHTSLVNIKKLEQITTKKHQHFYLYTVK
jgi:hypothetical protein